MRKLEFKCFNDKGSKHNFFLLKLHGIKLIYKNKLTNWQYVVYKKKFQSWGGITSIDKLLLSSSECSTLDVTGNLVMPFAMTAGIHINVFRLLTYVIY